jgi:hypothetical protein
MPLHAGHTASTASLGRRQDQPGTEPSGWAQARASSDRMCGTCSKGWRCGPLCSHEWAAARSLCPLRLWSTQGSAYRLTAQGGGNAELGNESRSSPASSSERDERADPRRDPRFLPRNADSGIDIRTPRRQRRKTCLPPPRRREDYDRHARESPILPVGEQVDAVDATGPA